MRLTLVIITCGCYGICNLVLGQTWSDLSGGVTSSGNAVIGFEQFNNNLYVVGEFSAAGGVPAQTLAVWNGSAWDSVPGWVIPSGGAGVLTTHDGGLIVYGSFSEVTGIPNTVDIAGWNGTLWYSVGSDSPISGSILDMLSYKGKLYAGGNLTTIGGVGAQRIAMWNDTMWSGLGSGLTGGFIPEARALAVYNNELYVGGDFTSAGGVPANSIARWNGSSWDSVGGGLNGWVTALTVDTINNFLYVLGNFTQAGGTTVNFIACWDGNNWSAVGTPLVCCRTMTMFDNELYVGGQPANATPDDTALTRWNGSSWEPVLGPNNTVMSLGVYNNELYVGGFFDKVNTLTVNYVAKFNNNVGVEDVKKKSDQFLGYIIPNPAKNEAIIPFTLREPKGIILLYGMKGELIQTHKVRQSERELRISLKGLADGTYLYILEIEGIKVDAKRMVVAR